MTCGDRKEISTRDGHPPTVHVCSLEPGHELPHVQRTREGLVLARWPATFTEAERQQLAARAEWRKPHKRKDYQTAKQWKAKQP